MQLITHAFDISKSRIQLVTHAVDMNSYVIKIVNGIKTKHYLNVPNCPMNLIRNDANSLSASSKLDDRRNKKWQQLQQEHENKNLGIPKPWLGM